MERSPADARVLISTYTPAGHSHAAPPPSLPSHGRAFSRRVTHLVRLSPPLGFHASVIVARSEDLMHAAVQPISMFALGQSVPAGGGDTQYPVKNCIPLLRDRVRACCVARCGRIPHARCRVSPSCAWLCHGWLHCKHAVSQKYGVFVARHGRSEASCV